VGLLGLAGAVVAIAAAPEQEQWRVRRYPLAAFRVEHPDRVRFTEDHWPARHISVNGKLPRAIFAKFGGFVEYRIADFAGAVLEGGYALAPNRSSRANHSARFRIELQRKPEAPGETLLNKVLTSGQVGAFRYELPTKLDPGARLTLRIDYGQKVNPGVTPRAIWIDPVFVSRVEQPGLPQPAAPNVVLITADTTRLDDLGSYGGKAETPGLDGLAKDGTRFSQAHSVAFGTTPSHASLMTSLPAARHGVYNNWMVLDDGHETLAERLRREGYETAAFVSARPLARALGLSQGFDRYEDIFPIDRRAGSHRFTLHERRGDATVDLFSAWFEERSDGPFFAWIHLFDPHQPYEPPAGYLAQADVREADEALAEAYLFDAEGAAQILDAEEIHRSRPEHLAAVQRVARARYRAEIRFLDEQVARVRSALQASGLYDSTLVIFVADHGENFLDREPSLAFEHAGLHREVTHIPLIVKLPKQAGSARQAWRHELVGNIDIAPTVLSTLGLEAPSGWEGESFHDASQAGRQHLVLEGTGREEVAVRTKRWLFRRFNDPGVSRAAVMRSLGFSEAAPLELYDLQADPEELTNLYQAEHPVLPELQALLDAFSHAHPRAQGQNLLDPRHREGLRALGYVE
jgi:arylsulfatase A-like enzyme